MLLFRSRPRIRIRLPASKPRSVAHLREFLRLLLPQRSSGPKTKIPQTRCEVVYLMILLSFINNKVIINQLDGSTYRPPFSKARSTSLRISIDWTKFCSSYSTTYSLKISQPPISSLSKTTSDGDPDSSPLRYSISLCWAFCMIICPWDWPYSNSFWNDGCLGQIESRIYLWRRQKNWVFHSVFDRKMVDSNIFVMAAHPSHCFSWAGSKVPAWF